MQFSTGGRELRVGQLTSGGEGSQATQLDKTNDNQRHQREGRQIPERCANTHPTKTTEKSYEKTLCVYVYKPANQQESVTPTQ